MSVLLSATVIAALVWTVVRRALGLDSLPWASTEARGTSSAKRAGFQVWLSQAGAAVTPRQFVTVSIAVGFAAFVVLFAVSHTMVVSLLPACGAATTPYAYWSAARRKQAALRSAAWPDAVRYLVGVLGAGIATLHDGLEELAERGPVALRAPMARYVRLSRRLGDRPALDVLRTELADPVADPVLLAFAGAVQEGTETVLRVLSDLGEQITADLQLGEKVRTLQTQSRVANWGCFALPYGVLFMLCSSNTSYRQFFSGSVGLVIVLVGVGVSLTGLFVSRRFVRPIATSRRVFAGGPQ